MRWVGWKDSLWLAGLFVTIALLALELQDADRRLDRCEARVEMCETVGWVVSYPVGCVGG